MNTPDQKGKHRKLRKSMGKYKTYEDLEKFIDENFEKGEIITPKKCGMYFNDRNLFYKWIAKCGNVCKVGNKIYKT